MPGLAGPGQGSSLSFKIHGIYGRVLRDGRSLIANDPSSHYEVFPEIPERWREAHRRGMAGEILQADEDRFERLDGQIQWVRWEVRPWHQSDGRVGGIVIFTEDITARKRMETALQASERRYRELVESANSAIIRWSRDGTLTYFNEYAQRLFG